MENLDQEIQNMWQAIHALQNNPQLVDHVHNFDASPVNFGSITGKKFYIAHTVIDSMAATAANYGVFFIAPVGCTVTDFREVHKTAGSDGGAVTVQLEKLASAIPPDSGNLVLNAALSLKATANVVQQATLTTTLAYRSLIKNDRLCLKDAGVLTAVANVTVIVELTVV